MPIIYELDVNKKLYEDSQVYSYYLYFEAVFIVLMMVM